MREPSPLKTFPQLASGATHGAKLHHYETGELPVIDEECCCTDCDDLNVSYLQMEAA